ncbi:MAG: DUF1738 domain-containing protein, partial [Campylobacterales bacterium]|nr:DUF1738 domain-containing protein [Campylobacterales bacterium]
MSETKNRKTFYEDLVAEKVIEAIEAGTAPWLKPWSGEELYQNYPRNGLTGKDYNGINNINLSVSGFQDPRWYTFKQAQKLDAKVKKGAKAIMIEHWRFKELVQEMDENNNPIFGEDGKPKKIEVRLKNPKASYAYVFNAEQIDGLPALEKRELPAKNFMPNTIAEEILKNSGADINHVGGGRAFYAPRTDSITLPLKEQFETIEGYYGTALHELGHWTGHESRLNRDLSGKFGTESYAREELRAELASFMLSSKIGIDFDPSQHYSYIGSWVKILTEEKQEIFKASRDAKKISDYIEGLSMEKTNQKMYNNDGRLTMEEAMKRIDISLGDASFGNPVYLKDGTVIMEHLAGETVGTVKSEGLYLFAGEIGKMKPLKSLRFDEAKALVADTYSIEQIKQEIDPKKMETSGAFLDSPYYYDEIRNEINSYLKDMKLTLDQDLLKEYEAAVVGMIESDGGYTIAEAVKEAYFDVNEKIHIEQVNTKFVLFDPITLKNVATADTLEDLKQEYFALTKNEFFKDMNTLVYEMKQKENGTWIANYDKKLDVDWNNFEKSISQSQEHLDKTAILNKQTYLYVPREEKEAAKSVGCRWDAENKAWYAPKGTELQKVSAWTLNNQQIKIGAFVDGGAMDTDPIVAFREELAKRGFELSGNPIADGNFHRVKVPGDKGATKSGSYRIHNDGRPNLYLKDFKNDIEESISHKESYFRAGADDKTIEAQKEINRIKSLQAQKDLER